MIYVRHQFIAQAKFRFILCDEMKISALFIYFLLD